MSQETERGFTVKSRTNLPHSAIELKVEIAPEKILLSRPQTLDHLNHSLDLPGFRKGRIPEAVLVSRLGELRIWEESLGLALKELYPQIVETEKIDALGQPSITVTKLAPGNPVELIIWSALMPEIILTGYREIAKEENRKPDEPVAVSEDEVEKVLESIRARFERDSRQTAKVLHKELEEPERGTKTSALPLDDDFARMLGGFNGLADLKTKLRVGLEEERKKAVRDKKRLRILESIAEKTPIDLPEIIVASELQSIENQFKSDLKQAGETLESYAARTNKDLAKLREEWRRPALKRAKLHLILNKIAERERIEPDQAAVDAETARILESNKKADRGAVGAYVWETMRKEKVFQFLENL